MNEAVDVASGVAPWFWPAMLLLALVAGYSVYRIAALNGSRWVGMATAALFGAWVVVFWEILVRALDVPRVLLPAPSLVLGSMADHAPKLWGDFVQTVGKAVLIGWVLGCALGFCGRDCD